MDSKAMQLAAITIFFSGVYTIPYYKILGGIFIAIALYIFYKIFKTKTK